MLADRDREDLLLQVAELRRVVLGPTGLAARMWVVWGLGTAIGTAVVYLIKEHVASGR